MFLFVTESDNPFYSFAHLLHKASTLQMPNNGNSQSFKFFFSSNLFGLKCFVFSAYCALRYFVKAGKTYSFPETLSGQVANSHQTCPYSSL